MAEGTVKWFSGQKGFGFISVDGEEKDAFVHYSDITEQEKDLAEGDRVSFELTQGEKGFKAIGVKKI